tara:strand:+ start:108 stop:605 length:498 start_codon:yes stop_codon:yes gene_type:complete
MLALESAFRAKGYDVDIRDACRSAGVHHSSYYDWLDNPDYRDWHDDKVERHFTQATAGIYRAIHKAAGKTYARGDATYNTAAQKLYLERFDKRYAPRTNVEHSGKVTWHGMLTAIEEAGPAPALPPPVTVEVLDVEAVPVLGLHSVAKSLPAQAQTGQCSATRKA